MGSIADPSYVPMMFAPSAVTVRSRSPLVGSTPNERLIRAAYGTTLWRALDSGGSCGNKCLMPQHDPPESNALQDLSVLVQIKYRPQSIVV